MSANGGTDAAGGTNRDRSFDFNTFASELFNSVTIRKSSAADIEEGSLGATVDLRSARPFDYDGFTVVTSVQGSYNDINEDVDPRGALLISNTFADGKFGALLSAAYTKRKLLDEGASTVRWQDSRNTDGTPSRERRSSVRSRRAIAGAAPTLAAAERRVPSAHPALRHLRARAGASRHHRLAAVAGRGLHAHQPRRACSRDSTPSAARSFSKRPCSARPARPPCSNVESCVDAVIDGTQHARVRRVRRRRHPLRGALRRAARPTSRTSRWTAATNSPRRCGCTRWSAIREAEHDNPIQTTLLFDRADVDGYSFDYRGNSRLPVITYGNVDVTNPATWTLSQIRLRPQSSDERIPDRLVRARVGCRRRRHAEGRPAVQEVRVRDRVAAALERHADQPGRRRFRRTSRRRRSPTTAASLRSAATSTCPPAARDSWLMPDLDRAAELFNLYDPSRVPARPRAGAEQQLLRRGRGPRRLRAGRFQRPRCSAGRCAATSACATSRPTRPPPVSRSLPARRC